MINKLRQRIIRFYLAVFAGLLVPGGAHIILGKTFKGVVFVIVILSTFFLGLMITKNYAFTQQAHDRHPVMYWLQYLVGAPAMISSSMKPGFDTPDAFKSPKMFEIGILYSAIAGLLNLLIFIDGIALAFRTEKKKGAFTKKPDDDDDDSLVPKLNLETSEKSEDKLKDEAL